ncbi:MAG: ATP-binding cassette domain-containing protein [Eggerthellaceae bacterium]|nr:ATP-binding cassette domain-containing protein [Eggerthellaceae bacterium]
MAEERKVLLSVRNLNVGFHVRGRTLRVIRNVSLDIYENESIAIVGESGSGKSVFTKTFAGMLDGNGFIDQGEIWFSDPELADVKYNLTDNAKKSIEKIRIQMDDFSRYEAGVDIYHQMEELKAEKEARSELSEAEKEQIDAKLDDMKYDRAELYNLNQTLDPRKERNEIRANKAKLREMDKEIKVLQKQHDVVARAKKAAAKRDTEYLHEYNAKLAALKADYDRAVDIEISEDTKTRNALLAKEIYMASYRMDPRGRVKAQKQLMGAIKTAMQAGLDFADDEAVTRVFGKIAPRVKYVGETETELQGFRMLDLAKMDSPASWMKIRGRRISTVFQDPMTSLNPIITIGKQITSIIIKHQGCTEAEARKRAIELMAKVGIPEPEKRFDDYPFEYSGGMRQRIVIAIALSCQPKILICDEPTTALDVTIQAQILQLIRNLQKEFGFTVVYITHDLGVVANVAERVAVMYAGQFVEIGTVEEIFNDPRHPYTWALLSSLPQLAERNTKLFSIAGTPPSLYNKITGDAFAPRNLYCMKIDTLAEPPMFQISDTHFAKTWLLDSRSPKIEKPEILEDIQGKIKRSFHIEEMV